MPIYEYECKQCGERFSLLRRVSENDEDIECPRCETRHPRRLFSTFAASGGGKVASSASIGAACKSSGPFR